MNQSHSDDYEPWRGEPDNAPAEHVGRSRQQRPRGEDDDDLGPGRFDRDLTESPEADLAPCPDCRKMLSAHATRCHHCGLEFGGLELWQYGDSRRRMFAGHRLKLVVVFVLVFLFFWMLSHLGFTPF